MRCTAPNCVRRLPLRPPSYYSGSKRVFRSLGDRPTKSWPIVPQGMFQLREISPLKERCTSTSSGNSTSIQSRSRNSRSWFSRISSALASPTYSHQRRSRCLRPLPIHPRLHRVPARCPRTGSATRHLQSPCPQNPSVAYMTPPTTLHRRIHHRCLQGRPPLPSLLLVSRISQPRSSRHCCHEVSQK
jgi:hypothetical protein